MEVQHEFWSWYYVEDYNLYKKWHEEMEEYTLLVKYMMTSFLHAICVVLYKLTANPILTDPVPVSGRW